MSGAAVALIVAAAGVGFGHAIMPDHWVPLAVIGRTRRYPLSRVARLSGLAGVAHVLVSLVLGAVIVAIGLQLRSTVQDAQNAIVGAVLIATGLGFIALELSGRGHHHGPGGHSHSDHEHAGHAHTHSDHEHAGHPHRHLDDEHAGRPHSHSDHEHAGHDHPDAGVDRADSHRGRVAGIMIPFGAAASPDLTILPVFLAAAAAGAATAIGSLIAFALATIGTIVGLTMLATVGGYRLRGEWLERWANVITALVLLVIGTLVVTGTI
jgi:nickel/cobalt transporter (NicO) family protein